MILLKLLFILKRLSFGCLMIFCLTLIADAQNESNLERLVRKLSAGTLQVEKRADPYKLTADFNADGIMDAAVIVNLAGSVKKIGQNVKIEYPYARFWKKEVKSDDLALFIIHGKGRGWQSTQKSSVLFLGRNSVLIFERNRLGMKGTGMEVEKVNDKKVQLVFSTEASTGILRWDGKHYVWAETEP